MPHHTTPHHTTHTPPPHSGPTPPRPNHRRRTIPSRRLRGPNPRPDRQPPKGRGQRPQAEAAPGPCHPKRYPEGGRVLHAVRDEGTQGVSVPDEV